MPAPLATLLALLIGCCALPGVGAQERSAAGLVHDENGKPLADVAVCPFSAFRPFVTQDLAAEPLLRTGADGRFAFTAERPLPRDCNAVLFVAPGRVHVAVGASHLDMTPIVLPKGSTMAGRIRDPSGKPLAGVRVQARDWLSQCRFLGHHSSAVTAPEPCTAVRSDANGRFLLSGTVDTAIRLTFGNDGFQELDLGPLAAGEPLDLVIDRAPTIAVRAMYAGRPCQGARVHIRWDETQEPLPAGITDAQGEVLLTLTHAGRLHVHIADQRAFGQIVVTEPEATPVVLELAPLPAPQVDWPGPAGDAIVVRGTLRDPDNGEPVANAWVGAMPQQAGFDLVERAILCDGVSAVSRFDKTRTGPDGAFTLAVAPGNYWLIAAEPVAGRPLGVARNPTPQELVLGKDSAPSEIRLELQPRRTVRGRLTGGPAPVGTMLRLVPQSMWVEGIDERQRFHDRFALDGELAFTAPARQLRPHVGQLLVPRWFRQGLPDKVPLGVFDLAASQVLEVPIDHVLPAVVRGRVRATVPRERLAVVSLASDDAAARSRVAAYGGPVCPVSRDGSFSIQEPPGSRSLLVLDLWSGVPLAWTQPVTVAPNRTREVELDVHVHEVIVHCTGLEAPQQAWLDILVDDAHWPAGIGAIDVRGKDRGGDLGVTLTAAMTEFRLILPDGDTQLRLCRSRQRRNGGDLFDATTWSSRKGGERTVTLVAH